MYVDLGSIGALYAFVVDGVYVFVWDTKLEVYGVWRVVDIAVP